MENVLWFIGPCTCVKKTLIMGFIKGFAWHMFRGHRRVRDVFFSCPMAELEKKEKNLMLYWPLNMFNTKL